LCYNFADRKSTSNVLIANNAAIDVEASLVIVVTYAEKLYNIYMDGEWGYWLCQWIDSAQLISCTARSTISAVVIITLERYVKVWNIVNIFKLNFKVLNGIHWFETLCKLIDCL